MPTAERNKRGLLTRAEVAQLARVEPVTVAKWQRQNLLAATEIDGVWYTPRAEANDFLERRMTQKHLLERSSIISRAQYAGLPVTEGQLASAAFAMLRQGRPPIDLVEELQLTPEEATAVAEQFAKLRDASLPPQKSTPHAPCAACGVNVARFCGSCSTANLPPVPEATDGSAHPAKTPA